jgi:hypothetical protein
MNRDGRGILAACGGRSLWRGSAWSRRLMITTIVCGSRSPHGDRRGARPEALASPLHLEGGDGATQEAVDYLECFGGSWT